MPGVVRLIDKPAGVTSHDVVARERRAGPKSQKIGHAGTLDPFATGLLIVLAGRATRAQRFFMGLEKEYLATARFGAVSTTGDPEGEITETGVVPPSDLELRTGRIRQRPPQYSAVRVGGRRAYELARAGEAFELDEREVTVTEFEQTVVDGNQRTFRIVCSSGTYVRSLIADLGDAYCTQLQRTRIGPFDVPESAAVDIELGTALAQIMPRVNLDAAQAAALGHGRPVESETELEGTVVAFGPDGLVAVATASEPGILRSTVGFVG